MPYYDFECQCGDIWEKQFSFAEFAALPEDDQKNKVITCPNCEGVAHRIFTRPASMQMNYEGGQRH